MGKGDEKAFLQRNMNVNKLRKRYSTSLVIEEKQIKTMRCTALHSLGWLESTIQRILSVGEDMEKSEHPHTTVGNVKWRIYFGKQSVSSSND